MAVIEIRNVTFGYGGDPILDGVDCTIQEGEHVGLVGANGAGKSTLLGVLEQDGAGTAKRIAVVPQFFRDDITGTAAEFTIADVLALRSQLRSLEEEMARIETSGLSRVLDRYGTVRELYDSLDGDTAESRAAALLSRVGMSYAAQTPVQELSGGEKNRIQIARALAMRPDLLILDEPGNHLDVWGLAWLEETLDALPTAVLVVSHNRYLLDRVATRILELRGGQIGSWAGNYSAYRAARLREAVKLATDAKADRKHLDRFEKQVAYLAQLARSIPDPSIGSRLRARRTQLRMATESARERPDLDESRAAIRLNAAAVRSDVAIELRNYTREIGGRRLLDAASLLIRSGERVALVGPNGCGKTTLLRDIVRRGSWDDPNIRVGPSMRIGYCAQHQELVAPHTTLADAISGAGGGTRDRVFALLSRYLFTYADLDRSVGSLSGGERNRLQLALAEVQGANLLILDEPTNHLDIPGREAVEEALLQFAGTILVVSHDRFFLDTIAGRVVAFEEAVLESYEGSFSDYWYTAGRNRHTADRTADPAAPAAHTPGDERTIERRLLDLEEENTRLERELTRAYQQDDLSRARQLSTRLAAARKRYDRLFDQWR